MAAVAGSMVEGKGMGESESRSVQQRYDLVRAELRCSALK